jgi:hypothetical protein
MLAHRRLPVCLSFLSTDLPILQTVETSATLYQKDQEKFHLLLTQEEYPQSITEHNFSPSSKNRLIWLEISPYRVVMTTQGNRLLNYRHFWEKGIYGTSRYWLKPDNHGEKNLKSASYQSDSLRLRNFTRNLELDGHPLPSHLRIEYELWSDKLCLGHYVIHLEIHH